MSAIAVTDRTILYSVYGLQGIGFPDGPVKIGFSSSPIARLKALQPGAAGTRLHIIFQVEAGARYGDGRHLEHLYHKRFAANRLNGEWFRFSHEMLTWVPDGSRRVYAETNAPAANTLPAPTLDIGDSAIFVGSRSMSPALRPTIPNIGDLSHALTIQRITQQPAPRNATLHTASPLRAPHCRATQRTDQRGT